MPEPEPKVTFVELEFRAGEVAYCPAGQVVVPDVPEQVAVGWVEGYDGGVRVLKGSDAALVRTSVGPV